MPYVPEFLLIISIVRSGDHVFIDIKFKRAPIGILKWVLGSRYHQLIDILLFISEVVYTGI
jgi:hypothetical protein